MSGSAEPEDKRAAVVGEVLRLRFGEGLSIRAIARKVQRSRRTVSRMLSSAHDQGTRAKAKAKAVSAAARQSILTPYVPIVRKLLDDTPELRAPAILERLRPLGDPGGLTIVRDLVSTLRPRPTREAFLTLDFAPGAAAQIDWADFGYALPGCPRRVSAFVMALCYSRYLYIEFTLSQAMGTFLRCMDRALAFFGGSTTTDIFDNMKTVVQARVGRLTVFNGRLLEYVRARGGIALTACNPRRGNEKGRVERPIGFVRERFWPGRRFANLADLNAQAALWRDSFANGRVHEATGKVPLLVYQNEERRLLKTLPSALVDTDDLDSQGVTKTFRVTFDRNRYSVPFRLVGQTVLVRANDQAVAIFLGTKQIALHARSWNIGDDIEHPSHKQGLLDRKPRASIPVLPPGLDELGEDGERYFKLIAVGRRSLQREIVRLTFLVEIFGATTAVEAVREVLATGHVGAEYVEYVIRRKKGAVPTHRPLRLGDPALDSIHFREPDLSVYDRLVPPSMTRDPGSPPRNPPPEESDESDNTDPTEQTP